MKKASTSTQEQVVFYYIQKLFPDAINRHAFIDDQQKLFEADVYIPSMRIAIEYDGYHWHKSRKSRDAIKNLFFEDHDIYVIHIREEGLDSLLPFYGIELWVKNRIIGNGLFINECITEAVHTIASRCNDIERATELQNYYLSWEQYWGDYPDIMSAIYTERVEKNITSYRESLYWNKKKNGRLNPQNISERNRIKVWLKCVSGEERLTQASTFHLLKLDDSSIISRICELYNTAFCENVCDYFMDQLSLNIENYINKGEFFIIGDENVFQQTLAKCGKTIELAIDLRLENNESQNRRFNDLFVQSESSETSFLRGYDLHVEGISILQKLKKIYEIYKPIKLNINPCGYDDITRKAWIDFYLWKMQQEIHDSGKMIRMREMLLSLRTGRVSDEFRKTVKEILLVEIAPLEEGIIKDDVMYALNTL